MLNLTPPAGFQGLHPHKPLTVYHRSLPRWRQDGASYFVTFRLGDSLPQSYLDELARLKRELEEAHTAQGSRAKECRGTALPSRAMDDSLAHEIQTRCEQWLDQGIGRCLLKEPANAGHVTAAMHHFDGNRYELGCYVVMPNHVHVLVRPLLPERYPLEELLGSWKKFSARQINAALGEHGELWQEESYDRIVRDEGHLWRVIQYIGSNPRRAGIAIGQFILWIRPEWLKLGWRFES